MSELRWFGVTMSFVCSVCGNESSENMALSAAIPDAQIINGAIKAEIDEGLICQICNSENVAQSAVTVRVVPLPSTHELKAVRLLTNEARGTRKPQFPN